MRLVTGPGTREAGGGTRGRQAGLLVCVWGGEGNPSSPLLEVWGDGPCTLPLFPSQVVWRGALETARRVLVEGPGRAPGHWRCSVAGTVAPPGEVSGVERPVAWASAFP